MAQLCALDIAKYVQLFEESTSLIYLYTYGSPRWCNAVMADYFESLIAYHFRVVNEKDVVPTVPLRSEGTHSPYHHTWREIWYTKDNPLNYTECDGSGEDKQCAYFGDSVEDHLNYLDIKESCSD